MRSDALDAVDQETQVAVEQLRALELMMNQQDNLHAEAAAAAAAAPDPELDITEGEATAATQAAMEQLRALETQLQQHEETPELQVSTSTEMTMVPAVEMRAAAPPVGNTQVYAQLAELEAQMA